MVCRDYIAATDSPAGTTLGPSGFNEDATIEVQDGENVQCRRQGIPGNLLDAGIHTAGNGHSCLLQDYPATGYSKSAAIVIWLPLS